MSNEARIQDLKSYIHYADYVSAMKLLKSLNAADYEEVCLKAGFCMISRKIHGKDAAINDVMRQFARACAN